MCHVLVLFLTKYRLLKATSLFSRMYRTKNKPTSTDSKVHVANMGPTWVLLAPGRPHVGPMNPAVRKPTITHTTTIYKYDNQVGNNMYVHTRILSPQTSPKLS